MGTIIYNPKKTNKKQEDVVMKKETKEQGRLDRLIENLSSVRPIGDTDCDYAIYLEDYVYTYLYQFAHTDLAIEHMGAIVGEYYPETKEVIICGVMPIPRNKVEGEHEWINEEVLYDLYEEKEKYFPGAVILGWMRMQPGYGTMLTTKEIKVHRELFDQEGSFLLLIDPISKIETFYAYEKNELKEQSGYYIYYDKNPSMQKFMLDKPFVYGEKEVVEDKAVNQFREINRRKHKEYQDRKRTNFTVITASIALLAMAAVVLRIQEQNDVINQMAGKLDNYENQISMTTENGEVGEPFFTIDEETDVIEPTFVIEEVKANTSEEVEAIGVSEVEVVESGVEVVHQVQTEESSTNASEVVEVSVSQEEEEVVETLEVEEVTQEDELEQVHIVESGETLRSISVKYYNTELRAKEISELNEMENGDFIYVGQELMLP